MNFLYRVGCGPAYTSISSCITRPRQSRTTFPSGSLLATRSIRVGRSLVGSSSRTYVLLQLAHARSRRVRTVGTGIIPNNCHCLRPVSVAVVSRELPRLVVGQIVGPVDRILRSPSQAFSVHIPSSLYHLDVQLRITSHRQDLAAHYRSLLAVLLHHPLLHSPTTRSVSASPRRKSR